MYTIMAVIQVFISIILIIIVLMQSQQSMNLSGMFGGASQSALGSQPQSVLGKVTTVLAIIFMVFSLIFSFLPRSEEQNLFSSGNSPSAPAGTASSAKQQSPSSNDGNAGGPAQPSPGKAPPASPQSQ